jgi:hypothetical protein
MSPRERELRSELKQLLLSLGLVRGNLSVRRRSCGKPSCHCMQGGDKHPALYLVASEGGKLRQLFIPDVPGVNYTCAAATITPVHRPRVGGA